MGQVVIKVFESEDGTAEVVDKIAQLLADDEPERLEVLRGDIQDWFSSKVPGEKITIVAEDQAVEGRPFVGVVRFWKTPYCDDIWLIEGLQVLESRRREGLGRTMDEHGLTMLCQRGVESVSANIHPHNLTSIKLHESLGFEKVSSGARTSWGI